ncbi:hypothetical protein JCM5296_000826 [Sporobolomyces johnsonii]
MRFHCLGVGSIGSLLATNLASLPSARVRLILRRKDLAAQLLSANSPSSSVDPSSTPYGSLSVERNGLVRRTDNLEMELTRNPADLNLSRSPAFSSSSSSSGRRSPRIDPAVWLRNDPIDTLFITTKAPQTLPALRYLLPRLSSRSTVVLCQNGMGVLESLLDKYWPEDRSDVLERERAQAGEGAAGSWTTGAGNRPSFICATTTHGAWRKSGGHFVHAGLGDLKFGVLPNRAVLSTLSSFPTPSWSSPTENPLLNPRSLVQPSLDHLPFTPVTATLQTTIASLLALPELQPQWLPLPTLQIAQLQKLAVNASVNSITALMGVNNGALVGSKKARRLVEAVAQECAEVFAAHIAREEGRWEPPAALERDDDDDDDLLSLPASASRSSQLVNHSAPPPLPTSHPLSAPSLTDYTLRILFKTSSNLSSTLSDVLALQSSPGFSLDNSPSLASRTEIEFINGYIVALGRRYGIDAPTVRTLGELVLLKEEMGRVGAVDRVWESRRDKLVVAAAANERAAARSQSGIFGAPSPPPRSPSPKQRAYDRAARHSQLSRESEERMREREVDRIRHSQGGGGEGG